MYTQTGRSTADDTARRLRTMARVRKLLRLAEDQPDQPEGHTAKQRAMALMAKHGLDRHKVGLGGAHAADYTHRRFDLGQREAWRRALVDAIAEFFDCVALYEGSNHEVETYGPEASLPQLEYTYTVYLRELVSRWKAHAADLQQEGLWGTLTKRQKIDHREAFCTSYVLGVKDRMAEDRRKELEDDPICAAATAKQRRELERWMRRAGVRWRSRPGQVAGFSDAGYQAGHTVSVEPALKSRPGPRRLAAS